jgi:hypothetical protein
MDNNRAGDSTSQAAFVRPRDSMHLPLLTIVNEKSRRKGSHSAFFWVDLCPEVAVGKLKAKGSLFPDEIRTLAENSHQPEFFW